jgi:hypothetical protein
MLLQNRITLGVLTAALYSTSAFCNQASTEYVKEALTSLRAEMTSQLSALAATTTTTLETLQNHINELPIVTHRIGEIFQGGVVFYVDASLQHGLMASLADVSQGVEWRNGEGGDRTVNASAQGLGSGETNTRLIVAEQTIDQQEGGQFAALLAANYQISADGKSPCAATMTASSTCYGGWYLPSAFELLLLHANLKNQGLSSLGEAAYWSSSEASATEAWLVDFSLGHAEIGEKSTLARVRAIHTF